MNANSNFTENELKRMFNAFAAGKESSLKWNTILAHFSNMSLARQKSALKKMLVEDFIGLKSVVDEVYQDTMKTVIEEQKKVDEKVLAIKQNMARFGISLDDLQENEALTFEPVKRKMSPPSQVEVNGYIVESVQGANLTEKNSEILCVLLDACDENMICEMSSTDIAEKLGQTNVWAGNGLIKLKSSGFIHRLGRNKIKVFAKKKV